MRPQHLIATVSLVGAADAFVGTAPSGAAFARRSPILKDMEGDSLSSEAQMSLKVSLDKLVAPQPRPAVPPAVDLELAQAKHGMPWTDTIGSTDHEDDPLLYMPFWEWQMEFMGEALTNLRPVEHCHDGTDFGYNENAKKKARIVNHCYASDEYRKIRMTYYDAGDSVQVFNSVFYPDPKYNLPILGIDLLAFNRKKYLAIVDFQPLHDDEADHAVPYEELLRPIKDEYDSLKGRMSSKFYDETQFFSKQMLFARFEDEAVVAEDLLPAFQRYVRAHVDMLSGVEGDASLAAQKAVLERQQAYDTYSAERDPATGLFAAMFGKEWADDFVFDFLFSLSERKEGGIQIPPMGMMGGGGGGPPPQGGGAPQGAPPKGASQQQGRPAEAAASRR